VHVVTEKGTPLVRDGGDAALAMAGRLRVRIGNGTQPQHDEAVFPARPPVWTHYLVKDDERPGAVFSAPMDGRSMAEDSADPHNGEQ